MIYKFLCNASEGYLPLLSLHLVSKGTVLTNKVFYYLFPAAPGEIRNPQLGDA